ncbi:unnamed protein product, partial [Meganyctiphanes norvegica]
MAVGWNTITITVREKEIDIGKFYTLTGVQYEVNDILFTGKYLTTCTDMTPMWKIVHSSDISIPLFGLSNFRIRLCSDQLFQPDLTLNNLDIPLSYDEELVIRKSNVALPSDDYSIVVLKHSNMISIFTTSV